LLILNASEITALAPHPKVIDRLREAFGREYVTPIRQVVAVPGGTGERLCLIMPAFDGTGAGIVKLSTVFPENRGSELPTHQGRVLVFSNTGTPIALLDGSSITHLRTAAVSALASGYLSRVDSSHLLVIGTGDLAPSMAAAHCAVRPIRRISIWGRRLEAAHSTATAVRLLVNADISVVVSPCLEDATASADIVTCATSSADPILLGRWLKAGTFVDLVGSFSANKREADDDVIVRSRVFVDTYAGALQEAGDLLNPLQRAIISRTHILGELADLVRERVKGRTHEDQITLFKSVGTAIEDLAIASLVVAAAGAARNP
jgi:ornithine cyclodeaminase